MIKNIYKVATLLAIVILVTGCKATQNNQNTAVSFLEAPQEAKKLMSDINKTARQLILDNNFTPFDDLQMQKLDRIEENSEVIVDSSIPNTMNGNQIYSYLKERTMLIGTSYLCESCPEIHMYNATGYVIHESGVIATNYHVIEGKEDMDNSAIFASDHEGNVYPVIKILAASQSNDLAIVQVNTGGKKLKHLPFAKEELVGEDIYAMGHSFQLTYFMTKGIIGRKYISERDDEVKIAVTAEFGQGGSGGPIVNTNGQLIGMISATIANYSHNSKKTGDLQLMVRQAIPVSVISNYVKRN